MKKEHNWKRQVLLFLVSQNLSLFGSSVVGFAIIWYVTLETSSGKWIMAATIATLLPQVLVSLWAGVIADRYSRKVIIMLSDGFTAVATLLAFLAFQAGHESLPLLIVISAFRSLGGGVQQPAVSALYPEIVPQHHLVRVNGINQTLNNILLLVSPAVGGMILGTMGIKWTFCVDLITAALAIVIMSRMKVESHRTAQASGQRTEKSSVIEELRSGIRYTWSQPLLRVLMISYAGTFILITPASVLSPLMIARRFGEEVWRLTANEMLWTAGSLAGGVVVAWKGDIENKITAIMIALIGFGTTFGLMGLAPTFALFLVLDFICGMFLPALITAQTVLIQTGTEPAYMGRVFSLLQFVSQGVMPIAILGFGPLGDRVKIQHIMVVCGALLVLWGFWFKVKAESAVR